MHFISTCIVAIGTLISAFWILAANSWMQTPQGFTIGADGRLFPKDWLAIIFNPSFPFRLAHMVIAAYLTTTFIVGGVGAYYLFKNRYMPHARIMLGMAVLMAAIVTPIQIYFGDLHGLNTLKYQPAKIAAIEGIWETEKGAGLRLFGWPSQEEEVTKYSLEIPKAASLILTHDLNGEIKGLKSWAKEDRPQVFPVFWFFRIMVGLGLLMLFIGWISAIQFFRGKLFTEKWLLRWWMLMMPSGFIALLSGWFVTEIGRQPYVAYGILRTAQSVSPAILGPEVAWSLLAFVVMYTFVFGAASFYILRLIGKGIPIIASTEQFYRHGIEATAVITSTHPKGEPRV
jgi:cytochrome bd ubiquinol oxidase subunit I